MRQGDVQTSERRINNQAHVCFGIGNSDVLFGRLAHVCTRIRYASLAASEALCVRNGAGASSVADVRKPWPRSAASSSRMRTSIAIRSYRRKGTVQFHSCDECCRGTQLPRMMLRNGCVEAGHSIYVASGSLVGMLLRLLWWIGRTWMECPRSGREVS